MFMEKKLLNIYAKISPKVLLSLIPFINLIRKINKKPNVPIKEKFAQIDYPKFEKPVIMLHGVSVGEIISLENLLKKIKETFKDYSIVLTTSTNTGYETANKKYFDIVDYICYFPLDTYKTVETFLNKINPKVILIAETELWPNFSRCAKEKNIPLFIINGRISDKSYKSYKKIKGFLKEIFSNYEGIFSQSKLDNDRFISLGADNKKCQVMKNLKFEIAKKPPEHFFNNIEDYKILIAGSTHKGEDEIVIETYKKLKQKIDNLKLIIAPRHLERLDDIKNLLKGFRWGLRTKKDEFSDNDIIILDTIGELSKIYNIVDVAFIGGSFNKTGGHNPLEATVYSKPTVSGPSIKNFRDIYSILTYENASFVVKNKNEFYNVLEKLFLDDEYYNKIAKNSENCFSNQQGALDFVIEKLKQNIV